MIEDLQNVKSNSLFTLLIVGTSTLCMGVGSIFSFEKELFLQINEWKLMLLAMSFSAPVWILNFIIISIVKHLWANKTSGGVMSLSIITSMLNILLIGTILLIKLI